jgi:peroxiredoxin
MTELPSMPPLIHDLGGDPLAPLSEQVAAFNTSPLMTGVPEEIQQAFYDDMRIWGERGIPAGVIGPGARMPDGDLLDAKGAPASLTEARNGGPAVVILYRGAWCPYCNVTLRTYEAQLAPALYERGIALIAISGQKPDGAVEISEGHDLSFTVLSDPGNQLAKAMGVFYEPRPEARAAQLAVGLDTTTGNADGGLGMSMATVAVVNSDGELRWIDVRPDYTVRTEAHEIIDAVDRELGAETGGRDRRVS